MIRNEREILNVVTSNAPKVASRPAGGMGALEAPPAGYGAQTKALARDPFASLEDW